jgi:hypothetical protein
MNNEIKADSGTSSPTFGNNRVSGSNIWSVFENRHMITVADEQVWIKELNFYMGDLSLLDLSNDWRTKAIEGRREQLKFLGLCQCEFPIKYPLILENVLALEASHYYR